jgi:hypothetical protein
MLRGGCAIRQRSALRRGASLVGATLKRIDAYVIRWARRKFKRLRTRPMALRHQLNVIEEKRRSGSTRVCQFPSERPGTLNGLVIVKPETVIRWRRAKFRLF